MDNAEKMARAFRLFDEANSKDPNKDEFEGSKHPKELLYAKRMTETLTAFAPEASEAVQLSARCQHLRRWEIPRDRYEMNRVGYLKWRQELKKFHAEKATEILEFVGYDAETIAQVQFLLLKKQLKKSPETQMLEDVICLVFMTYYLEEFAQKHPKDKLIDILQKTWRKMSEKGQAAALELPFSDHVALLVREAISG
ncbi:DUF4202 domain-containing protein [Poritiphilus flavus]|uniref:DUF4202 family protein n=1 Tax=Poritiphilus flavus TaxID=2697053 RepID=A0A6L9E7F1_9FLAO|nr:DUF4202 domain-containing protein [Poritiphilus flavus]NAS10564.1 DUF4202 family protein [Poritiphilus flavus]